MKYSVTLDHEIAKTHGWSGTRRRTITRADGSTETLVFGRKPIELDVDELPEEILSDSKLIVVDASGKQISPVVLEDGAEPANDLRGTKATKAKVTAPSKSKR